MVGPPSAQAATSSAASAARRDADGDDVVYLRTEDDLCLAVAMLGGLTSELSRRRDYLGARVFGSHQCELFSSPDKDSPADLWSCTFRLEQAVSVRALQELISTHDLNAGKSRRVLLYGHAIRLRHLPSQKFLCCLDTTSSGDKLAFDVGLAESNVGEGTWWRIHPASKQRSEGEKIRAGDDIILVSISTERYLNTEGTDLIQASFQQTFWRIFPVCVGTAKTAAIGHVNGCDVIRLFHRHVSQCLVARKDADIANRHPMYEIGAVAHQARSLWRVELVRMRFGGAFLGWGCPFRLRHVLSGKYLAVVRDHSTDTVSAELVMTPTLEQSLFCMLSSPDDEVFCEEKEATMGKPQIKFGDHVVYIRHINSLLWLGHQSMKNRKRVHRHATKTFQPVILSAEHHVDLGFTLTRAAGSELYAADVMHVALKEFRTFRNCSQVQQAALQDGKAVFAPSSGGGGGGPKSPPNLSSSASSGSLSSAFSATSSLGSREKAASLRRPSPTRLGSVQESPGRTDSPAGDESFSPGGTGSDNADIIAAFDATGGMRPLRRRSSQTRHRMFTFRQQSSFSLASMSTDSELDASKRKAVGELGVLSREMEAIFEAVQNACDELKEMVEELLEYFQWPNENSEHDKLQEQLKLLQHRQDLFQQQGLADLIVDTIEMVGRHLNMLCVRSLAGRRLGFSLVLTNQMLLNLLGAVVRGNSKTCTVFAREKLQCLDWLAERLRDFYADGVLQVLLYLLQESPDALNMVKEKHIQALINLLDTKGRDPKVLQVLESLCACAGNVAVRKNQNTIANLILPQRDLLLQTSHYKHIECVRPLLFVHSSDDDNAYHRWYCEVHVISFGSDIVQGQSYPLHLRVGWATSKGTQCWPGHASSSGIEAVGGTLSSVGFDGRSLWCGGQECKVPMPSLQRQRGRSGSLQSSRGMFKTIEATLKETHAQTSDQRCYKRLHTSYFRPGDKIGLCIDLHLGTVTYSLNGQQIDCHVTGFSAKREVVYPVISLDSGVRCSFHLGGKYGALAHKPPKGYAPLEEAAVQGTNIVIQRCVETGDLKHRELIGPPCISEHGSFTPNPVDVAHVQLPGELIACAELVARNVHESWSVGKIDAGWTYGERDDKIKTNPCLCSYQDLTPTEKDYDSRLALHTMRTLIALGYSIGLETREAYEPRYLNLNKKQYRQSNGYVPAPLDLACITIPDHLSQLLDTLARDAHNVWAAKRIGEGWSYGHSKCDETKRTPFLASFDELPDEVQRANFETVMQTIKTIIACGYVMKQPTRREESVGVRALGRESAELKMDNLRVFRGQKDQAIYTGKWYYEVLLKTSGYMRVGWCTLNLAVTSVPGTDEHAFVYDGFQARKWNDGSETFGHTWRDGDVIGCLLDLEKRTISFTLNGVVLQDAIGQEIAFDNLPEGQGFLPLVCLGPGQQVSCMYGRDLGVLKMFNLHGLQQGYEPLCSLFNHFMPMWASCNMPVFVDIGSDHPRLGSYLQAPAPKRAAYLRLSNKTERGTDSPRMECVRLNLGLPCDGSIELGKYGYDVLVSPGQDLSQTYIGWMTSDFRPEVGDIRKQLSKDISVCHGSWERGETEGTESNEEGDSEDDGRYGGEMLQCQALHVVCLRTLLAKEDVNDDAGILVSSVADTEEGEISFRFRGQELCQHSVAIQSEPINLFPVILFTPTGQDVLDFEFASYDDDCNNLLDGVLRCKRKHFVVPSRIRLECLEEAEWRMLPVNLPPLTTRQSPGGEMHVAFERQRMAVMVESSRELHSWNLPELVEMPKLMQFHTGTLNLYSGLCMQGNTTNAATIMRNHVSRDQLMECVKMEDLPGPLNRSFFQLLSTLHLERHVSARLLTRREFVIPLDMVKKAASSLNVDARTRFSVARQPSIACMLPGVTSRPVPLAATQGSQSLCSNLTRASNQSCSLRHCMTQSSVDFDYTQLKMHVLATVKQALAQHSYDNFRLTDQRQIDILVPLLACCDQLLVMGLYNDNDIHKLLVLLDPSSFSDDDGDLTSGLVSLPLHEDVKLQVCRLLQHLCDLQLRHRVESIVAFGDTFVGGMQNDQEVRLANIKESTFSAAFTAKLTREFRMSPEDQMRTLMCFKDNDGDCQLKEPLQVELLDFHYRLLSQCNSDAALASDKSETSPASTSSASERTQQKHSMLSNLVSRIRRGSITAMPSPQSPSKNEQTDSLQRLICTTMLSWAQQDIHSKALVRDVFDLLYRQYNGYKEVMQALSKAYVVSGNGNGSIQGLLEALGSVRSLLRVKMDEHEETLLCRALGELRQNTMIYQHPELMRLLGVHETVLAVMRNVLGEVDSTMFGTTASSSGQNEGKGDLAGVIASNQTGGFLMPTSHPTTHRLSGAEAIGMDHTDEDVGYNHKAVCQSPETVAACCRFLHHFCRTSTNNQRAMFDHLGYLIMHSGANVAGGNQGDGAATTTGPNCPGMGSTGGTPLDVAMATIRGNQELALALKEWQLEHVVLLLASSVTGLSTSELLGQKTEGTGSLATSSELFASSESFAMDDWKPNDGERYLNFLKMAVSVNDHTIEENASVIVRLLIRRPECLGPGLDGEGQGLLSLIRDYFYYIDLSLAGSKFVCEQDSSSHPRELNRKPSVQEKQAAASSKVGFSLSRSYTECSLPLGATISSPLGRDSEAANAKLASQILSYYANLLDLLARCTPEVGEDEEKVCYEEKDDEADATQLLVDSTSGMLQRIFYGAPGQAVESEATAVHRSPSQRRRAILRSLVSLTDLLGLLEFPFSVIEPAVDVCVQDECGKRRIQEPQIVGIQPQHKASIMLFLQRVYSVPDQKILFDVVEKSILADLRTAATVGNSKWFESPCVLELNRYICSSVMPFLVRYVRLFRDSEHHAVTLDTMLHTLYALSRSTTLTEQQRASISDFLCKLIKQLRPSILQRLLRKLVQDIPKLTKTTDVALTVLHCHYDHCARYYGLASGWGAFGSASVEEKDLTMQLFLTLMSKLSSTSIRNDDALYEKALQCLCAICSAMAPDYVQPSHLRVIETQTLGRGSLASCRVSTGGERTPMATPTFSPSIQEDPGDPMENDDKTEEYVPQPTDTSQITITDDLQEIIEVFSAHCHDSWAMRKFAEGYRLGDKRDRQNKKHPLLKPYQELTDAEKELSRDPCDAEIRAMIAWGWNLRKTEGITLASVQKRIRSVPRAKQANMDYVPQPYDLSHVPLSKQLMSMSERLAENRYDGWALSKISTAARSGVPLRHVLLPFDMLPKREKENFRILAQETLKFLLLCGYRVDRCCPGSRLAGMARQQSANTLVERRYAYVLFKRIITRQEVVLDLLEREGRVRFEPHTGDNVGHYTLVPAQERPQSTLKEEVKSRLLSLARLYIPVATHYFKCHHQYFMPKVQEQKRYGHCSREEKAQVADFFFNLVLILQAEDSIFNSWTCDIVDCVERVVKAFDMSLICDITFTRLHRRMVAFFRQARDDLAMRNVYREGVDVDPRDGYVFTVLIPVLTFVFKHIQSHNFGAQLIVNSIRTDTEKIIALLYKLGTEVDIFDCLKPSIGECLSAIASAMPMAFLETSSKAKVQGVDSTDGPFDGEMPVLKNLLEEVEEALETSLQETNTSTDSTDGGSSPVARYVLSDSAQEVPHAITVVVPMLSSYMNRWWDEGRSGMCVFGARKYETDVDTSVVDKVVTQTMQIIGNQFGVPNMDWISQAATDLVPLMRTCSKGLLSTQFLPMAKCLSTRIQTVYRDDQKSQGTPFNADREATVSHDYNILARDTYSFFTLCTAFVTSHHESWKTTVPKELSHLFLYLSDVLHCWYYSLNFRREFQICVASIKQRFNGRRQYRLHQLPSTPRAAQSPIAPHPRQGFRRTSSSLFHVHSSLTAGAPPSGSNTNNLFSSRSSGQKVSGVTPILTTKEDRLLGAGKDTSQKDTAQDNIIATCLNKMHPFIVQDMPKLDQSLVQKGLALMLRGAKEHEVADHIINVLQNSKKMSKKPIQRKDSFVGRTLSVVTMAFQSRSEPDLDVRLQRVMNLIRVLYRLHSIDNPRQTKHAKRWQKVLTRDRKHAILKCFLMVPLHRLKRHRAINYFLDVYREDWLAPEDLKTLYLMDDIKSASFKLEHKVHQGKKTDVPSSEASLLALEGATDPTTPVGPSGSSRALARPVLPAHKEVDPLCQVIKLFCRLTKCNSQLFFTTQDPLYVAYANILSLSCTEPGEDTENFTLQDTLKDASTNFQLVKQQDYLSASGTACMVVLVLVGCRGSPSPLVHQTLNLGIALLQGGNRNVQTIMLQFLKGSTDSEFFASIAGLIEECSVLDMDTYERHNKAADLGVKHTAGDRALADASVTLALFRFLQLLCEGHNRDFQNYLRTQPGNTSTINIVFHTVDYLHRLQESVSDFFWHYVNKETIDAQGRDNLSRAMGVAKQVFCTLTEYIQGPCVDNQLSLAKSRLWDAVGGFLHVFAKLQVKLSQDPTQLELLRELLELEKEMSVTLLAMLEETNVTIADKMVDTLTESVEHVEDIFKFFDMFLKLNDLATSKAFKDYDSNRDGWISNKEFEKAMEAHKTYSREEIAYLMKCADTNQDGRLDYMEFIERFHTHSEDIGFSFAVLLTNLSDHLPNDSRLAHFVSKGSSFLSHFEPYLGRVEIIGRNTKVDRVYFIIKKSTLTEWEKPTIQDSAREFFRTVDRSNQREKLSGFIDFCEDTIFEMQHGCQLSNTEHRQRLERAELHMRKAHLAVNTPLSWTYGIVRGPVTSTVRKCSEIVAKGRGFLASWIPARKPATTPILPTPPLPRRPAPSTSLITTALREEQPPSDEAASLAATPDSSAPGPPTFGSDHPLSETAVRMSRLRTVNEENSRDEPDTGDSTASAHRPTFERSPGNIYVRRRSRTQGRPSLDEQTQPSRAPRAPILSPLHSNAVDSVGTAASFHEDVFAAGSTGTPRFRRHGQVGRMETVSPLARVSQTERYVVEPVRKLSRTLSSAVGNVAEHVRRSVGGSRPTTAEIMDPRTPFSYIGTCTSTSSDIAPPVQEQLPQIEVTRPSGSGGSSLSLGAYTGPTSEPAQPQQPVPTSQAKQSSPPAAPRIRVRPVVKQSREDDVYKPQIALIQSNILALFARSYKGTKMTALVLTFVINFLLLFFKVVRHTADTNDVIANGTSVGLGAEEVGVEEKLSYWLSPLLIFLSILHFFASVFALVGYGMLKVPLVLFKREKKIAHQIVFTGKWIVEKPGMWDFEDRWDAIVLSSKSFPLHFWDSTAKRTARDKYGPQFGMANVCALLNVPEDDTSGKIRDVREFDPRYWLWAAGVLIMDRAFLYQLIGIFFSVFGNCWNYFFFSLHMLDIVTNISTLRTVLKSVTHNGRQLMMTFLMTCVVVYIYTVLAFNFFRQHYAQAEGAKEPKCNSMITCFAFHIHAGLRSGGGIGDSLKDPDGDAYELERMVFDITFFFFVIVILLAIIQGLIIDSFGELRDKEDEVKNNDETKCFVCGIGKERFDQTPHGFQLHIEKEHNVANYLFLFMYLLSKPMTEHTGQESYILENLKKRKLDFFPVGAAFRLSTEDHHAQQQQQQQQQQQPSTASQTTTAAASTSQVFARSPRKATG